MPLIPATTAAAPPGDPGGPGPGRRDRPGVLAGNLLRPARNRARGRRRMIRVARTGIVTGMSGGPTGKGVVAGGDGIDARGSRPRAIGGGRPVERKKVKKQRRCGGKVVKENLL